MRSLVLALAFAAPVCAVAATPTMIPTPTYATAVSHARHAKQDVVYMTFVNYTVQDREILIGDKEYKIPFFTTMHVYAPVGSPVFVYSETNSSVHGQELMRVSSNDANKSIFLK
ncbi:MAG: hypothetical protein WBY53_16560 [Acidobacteriaceae bacterium]